MRLRTVLRIARWEVEKGTDSLDRRTLAVGAVGLLLVAGIGGAVVTSDVSHDAGLYRVGVSPDSPYYGPVSEDPTFVVAERDWRAMESGELDLLITDEAIYLSGDRESRAALAELRSSTLRYNDRTLRAEANRSAAFPVDVRLEYATRDGVVPVGGDTGPDDGDQGGGGNSGGTDGSSDPGFSVPDLGGQPLFSTSQEGSPGSIQPPFPFGSLVLALSFVVPLNFVVQAYGASILRERIDRRGELLLVSPVSPTEIVAGKTLPYLLAAILSSVAVAGFVGGGPLSVVAIVPVALVFLAATFAAGMFARSYKELTFLTVTISVGVTAFLFVPAVFTEVTPIALISPLTVVVRDLLGDGVTTGAFLFATLPLVLSAAVLFVLGTGVYREEDMFSQRPVHLKVLDAFANRIRSARGVAAMTAALIPFVFVAELLAVALLFALPLEVTLPLLFVAIAIVEELAKSVHVLAGYAHGRFERTGRTAVAVGAASGLGFFLGEKLTVIAHLVRLPELPLGRAAFVTTGGIGTGPATALLVAAPLVLHAGTATVSALGARRGSDRYLLALAVAVVVHTAYNLGVVRLVA